ncbi:MAG TPA: TetR/AcrR family transcriptional regulator [Spirochaetia bacterium]|nr:TetR/AcrR family transcriptional regulator [Spirochaetia bacterium]
MAKGIPDADRRRMILDRSRTLFFERGMSNLTMDDVASLQGISKKTLYKFFPNKDALVSAVVEDRIAAIAQEATRLGEDSTLPWLERIGGIFRVVGNQISMISETTLRDIYYNRPDLWVRLDKFRREHVFSIVTRLLEEGRKKGFIRKDIDGQLVPLLFVSAISSVLTPSQILTFAFPPKILFESFIQILFGGILTDSARHKFLTQEART